MKVIVNYKRLIISLPIIFLVFMAFIKLINIIFKSDSNDNNDGITNNTEQTTLDDKSINTSTSQKSFISVEECSKRIDKIKQEFQDSELFSSSTKYYDNSDVIKMCNLDSFNDIACTALIDEQDGEYQEVVVVASPHKEDYDEIVRSMILRYQAIRDEYKEKYGDQLKATENISIKQEYGVTSFIISQNVSKVLNIIRSSR